MVGLVVVGGAQYVPCMPVNMVYMHDGTRMCSMMRGAWWVHIQVRANTALVMILHGDWLVLA